MNNIPSIVIKSIEFNNGQQIEFKNDDIVLLVGANNVGKSRTLKDLREDLMGDDRSKTLIKKIDYGSSEFSPENMRSFFERNIIKDSSGNYNVSINPDYTYCFNNDEFNYVAENYKNFYKVLFSFLSTESRLNITNPIRFGYNVDKNSLNIFVSLDKKEDAIKALNEVLTIAFEKSIETFNYVEGENVVSEYRIGSSEDIKNTIDSKRRDSLDKLKHLDKLHEQGDGIRSAVAILSSLIVNEHSLFLIDEPETFLHPPQAKSIGKNIVKMSENKQCFIATHNIDFIKGVVEANSSRVKIIKIDRIGNDNTFNLVNNDTIMQIANDKNLKYTNILDGLFYERLVLCENESDCKFYAVLLENLDLSKYQSTLFCAVGGKDQFKKVVPLLKELSIQYSIIADIDLIDNKENLEQLLNSIDANCYQNIRSKHINFLEQYERETNSQIKTQLEIKSEINKVFNKDTYISPESVKKIKMILKDTSRLKLLKRGGRSIIPPGDCVVLFDEINSFLNEHNIFIVECGEIECFIVDVGDHGSLWLEKVFTKHTDLNSSVYDNAKHFIKQVFNISD